MQTSNSPSASASVRDSADNRTLVEAGRQDLRDEQPRALSRDKEDPWLVEFDDQDPYNPKTWSRAKRWYLTTLGGLLVLNATFASSAPSEIVTMIGKDLGFGKEIGSLIIAVFVAGYCVGPIVWGPVSERIGRRPILIISFLFYTGWQVGCALSPNTGSLIVFRLLGGLFASAPLTVSGAVVGDLWDAKTRGKAMTMFSVAPFAGPALGPTVSGWIAQSGTNWRWIFWVLTIFAGVCLMLIVFTMKETYAPVLLSHKARRLRKETGESQYYSPLEADKQPFVHRAKKVLGTPFEMLAKEPILQALTVYMSFVYGVVYLLFEAYPIVFTEGHGLNPGVSGLMFLPIFIGGVIGCFTYLIFFNPRYVQYVDHYAPHPVPPEKRLECTLIAAPLLAISFFFFGWTSYSWISYWAPLMAGGLLGFSILLIFFTLFNYIVDTYLFAAASALSANTIVRSVFGAVFPLFARQMFEGMNPRWACTLLGCFAALMIPIPFILIKYGPKLRARSRFAPDLPSGVPEKAPQEDV
ncbi:MFS general substrate transporter [Peniophora sp. CONT]|nr:MFS general substrate transporter [Peniophora sp. CONT]